MFERYFENSAKSLKHALFHSQRLFMSLGRCSVVLCVALGVYSRTGK